MELLFVQLFQGACHRETLPVVQREAEEGRSAMLPLRGHLLRPVHNGRAERSGRAYLRGHGGLFGPKPGAIGVVLERGG